MGESYINLEKLFKDLSVLKEGLNEFIIVGSSIEDMEYKSCIMFHFENAYTEPYEFFKLEEKRKKTRKDASQPTNKHME